MCIAYGAPSRTASAFVVDRERRHASATTDNGRLPFCHRFDATTRVKSAADANLSRQRFKRVGAA